jgi:hypothetical protein
MIYRDGWRHTARTYVHAYTVSLLLCRGFAGQRRMARHGFFCSSSRTGKRIYMMQTATHTLHTLQIAVLRLSFGILMYALTCPPIHSYGPAIPASDHKERMGKEYDNADNACMRACPYTCQVCIFHATGRVCVCARARTRKKENLPMMHIVLGVRGNFRNWFYVNLFPET